MKTNETIAATHPLQPIITERTALLPIRPEDRSDLFSVIRAHADYLGRWMPEIDALLENETAQKDAIAFMLRNAFWTVRVDGRIIGSISLTFEPKNNSAEFGCWLVPDRAGAGYAYEAGRSVIIYAFNTLGIHRVFATGAVGNRPIHDLAVRLGCTLEGTMKSYQYHRGEWLDHELYSLIRSA